MWVRVYLVSYFLLVGAALLTLWRAGVLERLSLESVALALLVVIGLGALLALVSRRPA
jgi:hypothetical protein